MHAGLNAILQAENISLKPRNVACYVMMEAPPSAVMCRDAAVRTPEWSPVRNNAVVGTRVWLLLILHTSC